MPAKAKDLEKVARKLGFQKTRQRGSHARWKHSDGRSTTIPMHRNKVKAIAISPQRSPISLRMEPQSSWEITVLFF